MTISTFENYQSGYSNTVYSLVQQQTSMLRDCVRIEKKNGNVSFFNRIGKGDIYENNTQFQDAAFTDMEHSSRMLPYKKFIFSPGVDEKDIGDMLLDPTNYYVQEGAKRFGRKVDEVILAAAKGTAITGRDGAGSATLPAGQIIAAGGTGTTIAKLRQAKKLFDNLGTPNEDRYAAISGEDVEDLLDQVEIKSADYNSLKPLVDGEVGRFLGFNFRLIEKSIQPLNGASRQVICWRKDAIILSETGVKTKIVDRDDKIDTMQIKSTLELGAVRMEEEAVVIIEAV